MSFFSIKNNDLANADIVMSNFRNVNYGNPLNPVNYNGMPVNNIINLGSPVHQWNNLYVNNIFMSGYQKYIKGNYGDIHYLDKNNVQQPIPIGKKLSTLQSQGEDAPPKWVEPPIYYEKLLETDFIKIRRDTFNQNHYEMKGHRFVYKLKKRINREVDKLMPIYIMNGKVRDLYGNWTTEFITQGPPGLTNHFGRDININDKRFGGFIWTVERDNETIIFDQIQNDLDPRWATLPKHNKYYGGWGWSATRDTYRDSTPDVDFVKLRVHNHKFYTRLKILMFRLVFAETPQNELDQPIWHPFYNFDKLPNRNVTDPPLPEDIRYDDDKYYRY